MMESAVTIQVGSVVTVREAGWDETEQFQIVLPHKADPAQGLVSNNSPFGLALINKAPGEQVSVEAPVGEISFEILDVN